MYVYIEHFLINLLFQYGKTEYNLYTVILRDTYEQY